MKPWNFYSALGTGLLYNSYDTVAIRSQSDELHIDFQSVVTGTGIQKAGTEQKRKRKDGTLTRNQHQGRCVVCKGKYNKSGNFCS